MKTSHSSHASDFVVDYAVVAGPGLGPAGSQGQQQYFSQGPRQRQRSTYAAAAADVDVKPQIDQVSIGIGCDIKPIVYLDPETQQTRQRSVIIKQQQQQQLDHLQAQQSSAKSGAAGSSSSKRKREKGEWQR